MVSRTTYLPRMSVGYSPTCLDKSGLWPCYPMMPRFGLMGLGAARRPLSYPIIPRYGLSDLSTGLFCWPPFGDPNCSWGIPEILIILFGGYVVLSLIYTTGHGGKQAYIKLEGRAQKRRKAKAKKYRERAAALEAKGLGGVFA